MYNIYEPECDMFEVTVNQQTEQAIADIRKLCRIPTDGQTIWYAAWMFDFCNQVFAAVHRPVLTSPDGSRHDTDLWPPEPLVIWSEEYLGEPKAMQYPVNEFTTAIIARIKTMYTVTANDELLPLMIANLQKINQGIMEDRDIQFCHFAGGNRQQLALTYPPYGYQLSS